MTRNHVALVMVGVLVVGASGVAIYLLATLDSGVQTAGFEGVSVRPGSIPSGRPLIGPSGAPDEHGYPRQHVDQVALQALLRASRFSDLTRHLEAFQSSFEQDWRYEAWPIEAAYAFRTADPSLTPLLDAWVEASPDSFAPYLARCAHVNAIGLRARGGAYLDRTQEVQLTAMQMAFERARPDCERALELRPRLVAAHQRLLVMGHVGGDAQLVSRALEEGLRVCPSCYGIRAIHLHYRTPRWGGSHAAMEAFARDAIQRAPESPRLRALAGYVEWDRCRTLRDEQGARAALPACDAAIARGQDASFFVERARTHVALDDAAAARADVDRALELEPQNLDALLQRYRLDAAEGRWAEASDSLLTVARLDATDAELPQHLELARRAARRAVVDGGYARDWSAAERGLARAADLGEDEATLAELRQQARAVLDAATARHARPDDLAAHQALDAALLPPGRLDLVIAMWTEYLERHPDDGHAHLERGGAHFHLGQLAEAERDARRACELGVAEGCARAQQIAARPR